jgi:outer membrane lipoprotein LolB
MRRISFFAVLILFLFLYGCATQIEPPNDNPVYKPLSWHKRKVHLSDKKRWNIQGAVSIRNRGKTQMGSFTWQQIYDRYAINLYGPLNLGAISIAGNGYQVTLAKPTGRYTAPTPEALMQQQLGWYLPISNMYYWVRGLPAPGKTEKQVRDDYGHLVFLEQQGWNIQFAAFQPCGNADLPRKIILDNHQLHVKLVINNWDMS